MMPLLLYFQIPLSILLKHLCKKEEHFKNLISQELTEHFK